jgi:hypothetical protein
LHTFLAANTTGGTRLAVARDKHADGDLAVLDRELKAPLALTAGREASGRDGTVRGRGEPALTRCQLHFPLAPDVIPHRTESDPVLPGAALGGRGSSW